PASGLDPRARVEMRELLKELRAMGKTILVSSHILSEVEEVCTHIGIIEKGSLVAAGSLAEIQRRVQRHRSVRIGLVDRLAAARSWLAAQTEVSAVEDADGGTLDVAPGDASEFPAGEADGQGGELRVAISGNDRRLADLLARLVGAGFAVVRFQEERDDLEDVFLRLTTGAVS
ncbi:MAG: multidrug ABC transporter ATP-binding protein, partial [Anaerolineales bacterium]|nr:multidrug ABC transporter ATP-binding protein [Anaerolineales bacterium]